jgi:hypothetical protein
MGIINKFEAAYTALQSGKELVHAKTWANRANAVALLTAFLTGAIGLAREFGVEVHVTGVDIAQVALGITTLVQIVVAVIHTMSNPNASLTESKRK